MPGPQAPSSSADVLLASRARGPAPRRCRWRGARRHRPTSAARPRPAPAEFFSQKVLGVGAGLRFAGSGPGPMAPPLARFDLARANAEATAGDEGEYVAVYPRRGHFLAALGEDPQPPREPARLAGH